MGSPLGGILQNVPLPINDPIAQPKRASFGKAPDPQEGKITLSWIDFFTSLGVTVAQASSRVAAAVVATSAASIGATDVSNGDLLGGFYRFSYYAQIITPGSVSSTLTVTLDWVNRGNAQSQSGTAITGNTVNTHQSGSFLIEIDEASPVRYSTTYGSIAGGTMTYALGVFLERVQA